MSIEVSKPDAPTITVNGNDISKLEVKDGDKSFTSNRDPVDVSSPATVRFSGPSGSTVRFTFNSKHVNLSSPEFDDGDPPVLRDNGNGFDSDTTTIRAKAYKDGDVSEQVEAVVRLT